MSIAWIIAWFISLVIAYYIGRKDLLPKILKDLNQMGKGKDDELRVYNLGRGEKEVKDGNSNN